MNKILLVLICCSAFNAAQAQTSNLFEESFEGMFDVPVEPIEVPTGVQGPLNPAVPLDGGLTALLVAGGAVGYRKYRARSKNN